MTYDFTTMPLTVNYPWYTFTTRLTGVTYTFEVFYNTRADRWRMHIYDITGTRPLLLGIPLLIERDLTGPYRHLKIPPGYLVGVDINVPSVQPGLSSFLLSHQLVYVETTP